MCVKMLLILKQNELSIRDLTCVPWNPRGICICCSDGKNHSDGQTSFKVEVMHLKLHLLWKQTNHLWKTGNQMYFKTHTVHFLLRDLTGIWTYPKLDLAFKKSHGSSAQNWVSASLLLAVNSVKLCSVCNFHFVWSTVKSSINRELFFN